ncbi:hypothetical protein M8C13_09510 [Crossiella sp. SN42]|uniref:hypothetical protein n=1 Tax=Crossiella sp. SN42 TaxID=2944808 RepID=UPI00207C158C|nr:hypothetical protein [Crossiella sp. SN42]MCO1575990.1 hypothetical protein [Crossiella sp. SN42]
MNTLTRLGLGVTALVTAFTLSACGGEDKADGPASLNGGNKGTEQKAGADDVPKDPKAAMLKFAACMRENGVDFPDPDPNSGGMARAIPMEGDHSKMDKANEACKKYLPKSDFDPNDPKEKDKRAKMNQCLREKGIDIKEAEGGNGATINLGDDKEKAEKAMKECGMGNAGMAGAEPVK